MRPSHRWLPSRGPERRLDHLLTRVVLSRLLV